MTDVTLDMFNQMSTQANIAFGNDTAIDNPAFYHFYHIPKCGGMDFYTSLLHNFNHLTSLKRLPILTGRVDSIEDISKFESQLATVSDAAIKNATKFGFFASHLGEYAFNRLFPNQRNVRKITFIREPFSRLLSNYTYSQMRKSMPVSEQEFAEYIEQSDNQNVLCNSLFPGETSIKVVKEKIKSFYIFTTLNKQNEYLQKILYQHGLFNTVRDPINETRPKYRLDELINNKSLKGRFRQLNKIDLELWEEVNSNPIEPEISPITHISTRTIIIIPQQQDERFTASSHLLQTQDVIKAITIKGAAQSLSDFMQRFEFR